MNSIFTRMLIPAGVRVFKLNLMNTAKVYQLKFYPDRIFNCMHVKLKTRAIYEAEKKDDSTRSCG